MCRGVCVRSDEASGDWWRLHRVSIVQTSLKYLSTVRCVPGGSRAKCTFRTKPQGIFNYPRHPAGVLFSRETVSFDCWSFITRSHPGVVDVRGRPHFSGFDPRPGRPTLATLVRPRSEDLGRRRAWRRGGGLRCAEPTYFSRVTRYFTARWPTLAQVFSAHL